MNVAGSDGLVKKVMMKYVHINEAVTGRRKDGEETQILAHLL